MAVHRGGRKNVKKGVQFTLMVVGRYSCTFDDFSSFLINVRVVSLHAQAVLAPGGLHLSTLCANLRC